jgi:REP element-mobilizing transposase RayT
MANTYTQIYIHGVFCVQDRYCLISKTWKDELFKYITGITQNNGHKLIAINGMADHLHIFIGMKPSQSLSDLMQDIKGDSSKWINGKGFLRGRFSWQEGFGAFSYSSSQIDNVVKYINNQEVHHKNKIFIDEYKDILKKFNINFDDKYLFKIVDQTE